MATLHGTQPAAQTTASGWQIEFFTVSNPPQSEFNLANNIKTDDDGDPLLIVKLNGLSQTLNVDYTLNNDIITWTSQIALEAGEVLEVFYQEA